MDKNIFSINEMIAKKQLIADGFVVKVNEKNLTSN